ncbi:hypothetical protein RclHR1_00560024 [Rhizophagus clarus]|nr:hypothetical protein RclHR1_00560024 [Rhizophagus clarus]
MSNNKRLEKSVKISYSDIKVVVGLDFGTVYSGFSYCHVASNQEICSNDIWPGEIGRFKTNTILQYDDDYNNVVLWGAAALAKRPNRRQNSKRTRPVELFKLYLGSLQDDLKPSLPIDYKKAITDFLREIGKVIKERIECCWPSVNYFENVLLVLTVPAEYSVKDISIMRECIFYANLIKESDSQKLRFTTESDATALYCGKNMSHNIGETIMIIDCGKGTVDITTRTLIGNNPLQLGEVTAQISDFCGSAFIDDEFVKFLRERLGNNAIDGLIENHYSQYQFIVKDFCQHAKDPFTGDDPNFSYMIDIAPSLYDYEEIMEEFIDVKYNDIKEMFDIVVNRIIRLIHTQFSNIQETCSRVSLVGEFSENRYLQNRIKEEFGHRINNISIPVQPTTAIARGAVIYGLSVISTGLTDLNDSNDSKITPILKVLKYTYGIECYADWKESDPLYRKTYGKISRFSTMVKRGTNIEIGQSFSYNIAPEPNQASKNFAIYYTREYNAEFCDESGMRLLGVLRIDLPDTHLDNRNINFELIFGENKITAFARNEPNGQKYMINFPYSNDDY